MLIRKIFQELQDIPEDKLAEIYDLSRHFRLDLGQERAQPRISGLLTGRLGDAFFEPYPKRNFGNGSEISSRHPDSSWCDERLDSFTTKL
jgi:hypothetical protein